MARRVAKGLLLLEAAGLLGALLLYRAMDRSQGFRWRLAVWLFFFAFLLKKYITNPWRTDVSTCRDFRYTMQKRFPSILEVYYKSNEWSGIHGIRENDQMAWLSSKN